MNRKLLLLTVILVFSACANLDAQRGGAGGMGHVITPPTVSTTRPDFSRNSDGRAFTRSGSGNYDRYSGLGYPYWDYYGDYWDPAFYGPDNYYAPRPDTGLVVPVPQPVSPPSPPAEPVVTEYSWPDSANAGAPAFAIVSKDGTVYHALAVWVQDNTLCFTAPNGIGRHVSLNDIDGAATTRMNAELKLKLPVLFGD